MPTPTPLEKQLTQLESKGYTLDYCPHCECVTITCPQCKHASCSGGGCAFCCREDGSFLTFGRTPLARLSETALNEFIFQLIPK